MGANLVVTGMVISTMPMGEYDKRITLLTKERGKITAFARGARRPNSQLLAATNPFSFGEFELFEGRSTYNMAKATISNYFRNLALDPEAAYYGFYFLEFADYYCQENSDEKEMLKLLYQSLRALESSKYENRLVRVIFELKALAINGEGPKEAWDADAAKNLHESTVYTMQYIVTADVSKLFTFAVKENVLLELEKVLAQYMKTYVNHSFKALKILEEIF